MDLPPTDPIAERIGIVRAAGEKPAELTHQLLAFSRRQVLELRVVNATSVIENISKMLTRIIGVDIQLELHALASAGTVMADSGQLEQVLMNLAVNARDAMPAGGRLIIETSDVTLDQSYAISHEVIIPGPYVMIAVSDNGVERIQIPGDCSYAMRGDRLVNGIPLPAPLRASLDQLAAELKIAPLI